MKSPITGQEMTLQREERELTFRKEVFSIQYHYYLCETSGEQFTSTELDEINTQQLYNQYRGKHNLPFPEDIRRIRETYGLSAVKMSEVLGFGVNGYRNYEQGEVPSQSNGKLIQLAGEPRQFRALVAISDALKEEAKAKLLRKIDQLIEEKEARLLAFDVEDYLLSKGLPDEYSGYRTPSLARLTEMVVFFTEQLQPWKTQMNKLLFYADFLLFQRTCFSMSGARYRAITMGPVPNNYNSIFEYMANNDAVDIRTTTFKNGVGEQFQPHEGRQFNAELFDDTEVQVLDEVAKRFRNISTAKIIEISHRERAWTENEGERRLISYRWAFGMNS